MDLVDEPKDDGRAAFKERYFAEAKAFMKAMGPSTVGGVASRMGGMHGMDPAEFCRKKAADLPIIVKLCTAVYPAVGSSAGPESVFSHVGRIVGKLRTRLTGPRTEKIVRSFIRHLKTKAGPAARPRIPRWYSFEKSLEAAVDPSCIDDDPDTIEEGGERGVDDITSFEAEMGMDLGLVDA
jgi:hypothetical protein